jgi:ferredoxin-NADP reductase
MSDAPRRSARHLGLAPTGEKRKPPVWQMAEVVEVIEETPETRSLRLRLPDPSPYLPGQYYNIRIPVEGRPRPIQRAYSLGSSPHPSSDVVEVGVKEMVGGLVSPVLVRESPVGTMLEVRGPYGAFVWTENDGGPVLLVGAGSGVVPLMAMIRYQVARGIEIPMHLLFSSKSREFVIYGKELDEIAASHPWFRVTHTYTRDATDTSARYHRRIDKEMIAECMGPAELAYICGPPEMVEDAERVLVDHGLAPEKVHTEKYD